MLALDGVARRFAGGVVALEAISLRVDAGDFLVLLGPSGCGKSTLLRLIAGLDLPDAGSLAWADGPPAAGDIGFVFQDATLMPWASALDNVALPLRLRSDPQAFVRAKDALRDVGLAEFIHSRPAALSGGMRMRVSIARALVARPRLLLMDEPFAALDEFTRQRLQDEVLRLTSELNCTVVFVTHSLYEAAYLASRVVVMSPRPGRIAAHFAYGHARLDRISGAYTERVAELTLALRALQVAA
jgi:NitT/TauT family transport system ATP-binding protein